MSNKSLAVTFKLALEQFLEQPDPIIRTELLNASIAIYKVSVAEGGREAADFTPCIVNIFRPLYVEFKELSSNDVHQRVFSNLLNSLATTEDLSEVHAFHALAVVEQLFFIDNPQENIRHKLYLIKLTVEQFEAQNNVSAPELKKAFHQIEGLVNQHFALDLKDQKINYQSFQNEIKNVCNEHKKAIEGNGLLKQVFYNLLAAVAGLFVFYCIYLAATAHSRGSFFLQPDSNIKNAGALLDSLSDEIDAKQNNKI